MTALLWLLEGGGWDRLLVIVVIIIILFGTVAFVLSSSMSAQQPLPTTSAGETTQTTLSPNPGGSSTGTSTTYSTSACALSSQIATTSTSAAAPSFWIDCIDNSTVPMVCKFQIIQGESYSVTVPMDSEVAVTFFGNGVISLPTLSCTGSNCPWQIVPLEQSEICTPGANFCPLGRRDGQHRFPGSRDLFAGFQLPERLPGGPQVSNSLTVIAK